MRKRNFKESNLEKKLNSGNKNTKNSRKYVLSALIIAGSLTAAAITYYALANYYERLGYQELALPRLAP